MANKQSGIDINLGNKCSINAYKWAKKTFANRKNKSGEPAIGVDGTFSNVVHFKDSRIGISSDGIGTKIEVAERTGIYDTLGYDLVAMVVDDLVANGFEPTNISNILDIDFLDYKIIDKLMKGLHDAAGLANIAVTGGEIAELGNRINGYGDGMHFNWCSTAIGILPDVMEKPIDGVNISPGDVIISLKSQGFRSNGFSIVRKIMKENFGNNWHKKNYSEKRTWGEVLITPSLIYCKLISDLIAEGFQPKGIAHITGGGLADNLGRVLKATNTGAVLNNIFEPADFVLKLQEVGEVSEEQAYCLWNMGNGILIIVLENEVNDVMMNIAKNGFKAQVAGYVVSEPIISIKSKGIDPQTLKY
ncbi:MAG: phosphoribosylformylglycinamidine cyclo-ligase [Candidatus Cloacimonetes bacterium]|nr:phosphoribosylformylglycinamidine cyclo-ligase [Candidatus Cloacimonadota bacterium]